MKNPLRDEGAAFQMVFLTLGACALIVLAAWINTWLGAAVFAGLVVAGVLALRGGRGRPVVQHVEHPPLDPTHRLLVVANETVGGAELLAVLRAKASVPGTVVFVVCPALNSRVRTWTSDEDAARDAAQRRLDASLARLASAGIGARGEIGDGDPLQAVEDTLHVFPADEVIVSTHPPGRSNWLEGGVVDALRARIDVPVSHVVVDLETPSP